MAPSPSLTSSQLARTIISTSTTATPKDLATTSQHLKHETQQREQLNSWQNSSLPIMLQRDQATREINEEIALTRPNVRFYLDQWELGGSTLASKLVHDHDKAWKAHRLAVDAFNVMAQDTSDGIEGEVGRRERDRVREYRKRLGGFPEKRIDDEVGKEGDGRAEYSHRKKDNLEDTEEDREDEECSEGEYNSEWEYCLPNGEAPEGEEGEIES